ncbi:MAG: PEP-CTERM sorting domain-containing protein [Planctomycetota bacterium]
MDKHLFAAVAVATAVTPAFAQVTTGLSDEATFAAANPGALLEDFQDETIGSLDQTVPTVFNGFSTLPNGTSTFLSDYEIDDEVPGSTNLELDLFIDSDPTFITEFFFTFDDPVSAFALRIDDITLSQSTFLNVAGQSFELQTLLPGTDDEDFFTFSSPTPITSFSFTVGGANGFDGISVDNVYSVVVPEPTSVAMLGLAATGLLRRRR